MDTPHHHVSGCCWAKAYWFRKVSPMTRRFSFTSLILLTFFFAGPVLAEHEGKVQILLFGDSTTEGSVPRRLQPEGPHLEEVMEQLLNAEDDLPPCRVINSSQSGETIKRLFDSGRYDKNGADLEGIDYIFIRYGINDKAKRENFPVNFVADFHGMIERLRKDHPGALIIPMTVIPFSSEEASKEINDLIRQVARDEKLEVFDIYPRYAAELEKGYNMLNYRRYPLAKIPEKYHEWLKPRLKGDRVEIMGNELDGIFGHLPGWTSDRHPNLAGYNVIADETVKYLAPILRKRHPVKTKVKNAAPVSQ